MRELTHESAQSMIVEIDRHIDNLEQFRDNIMEQNVTYLDILPAGAFKESGTMVNTILLRLEK